MQMENEKPLVTVIVPCFNHRRYLEQRLESVLGQTYGNKEIILLDDASTDGSQDILRKYSTKPQVTHTVMNERNSGSPFLQWAKGVEMAKGKYIWIAESDDFSDPLFLESCVEELERRSGAVVCVAASYIVDEDNQPMEDLSYVNHPVKETTFFEGNDYLRKYMFWRNRIYNSSMAVVRRECTQRVSKAYTRMHYLGDWIFWTEVVSMGGVVEIPQKLNYFRQHRSNTTKKGAQNGRNLVEHTRISLYYYNNVATSWAERMIHKKTLNHYINDSGNENQENCKRMVKGHGVNSMTSIIGTFVRYWYYHVLRKPKFDRF